MKEKMASVLRDAKEYLFEKGWHQGDYGTEGGAVCLAGACLMVEFGNFYDNSRVAMELTDALNTSVRKVGFSYLAAFNDCEDTKFDDVIDMIDVTIKRLETEWTL